MGKERYKDIKSWQARALRRAESLTGRQRIDVEKKFANEHEDRWDYFYVFGCQPETQAYIDETIRQLKCMDMSHFVNGLVPFMRLEWSIKDLKGGSSE